MASSRPQLHRASKVQELWETYRAGQLVLCPEDGTPMAIAIDGTSRAYRFVCVVSGLATPWFSIQDDKRVLLHAYGDQDGSPEEGADPTGA
jgi:hypothetical protein